jgi:hypothetical protein
MILSQARLLRSEWVYGPKDDVSLRDRSAARRALHEALCYFEVSHFLCRNFLKSKQ